MQILCQVDNCHEYEVFINGNDSMIVSNRDGIEIGKEVDKTGTYIARFVGKNIGRVNIET